VNDSWAEVLSTLGPFASVEPQVSCRRPGQTLPAFFTCTRGRVVHRLDHCTASFVQMQCDLVHCDTMIGAYERAHFAHGGGASALYGARPTFDFVTWLRLDVAWEVSLAPPLPLAAPHGLVPSGGTSGAFARGVQLGLRPITEAVWLPQMNSQQGGLCDKFAFGTRRAMSTYLHRYDLIDLNFSAVPRNSRSQASQWTCAADADGRQVCTPRPFADTASLCKKSAGCMLSMNSERFVAFALYHANLTVVRMKKWAFCKFGDSTHAWPTCTSRLRAHRPCRSLNCPSWQSGGCQCSNKTCTANSWYCVDVPEGPGAHGI